ncbi:hypothetical protein P8935_09025 [Telmatobacter sp. DSM 110680]|uniref:Uncharacterized protein n=1 Tax=Telmatobacter sp. DSM 110680 TaxID=3036704 RepID=A0AAU7DMR8_9BACT
MDPSSIGAKLSTVRAHLEIFVVLLVALPAFSFLMMKFWIAGRSAKVQRNTNWFVPTDLESEAAKMHYSMQHNSVAFAHVRRNQRTAVTVRKPSSRRSA